MDDHIGSSLTVQGPGTPVPAAGGEQAGHRAPSTNDCNDRDAAHLAPLSDNTTSEPGALKETSFQDIRTKSKKNNKDDSRSLIERLTDSEGDLKIQPQRVNKIHEELAENDVLLSDDTYNNLKTEMEISLFKKLTKQYSQNEYMYKTIQQLEKELKEVKEEVMSLRNERNELISDVGCGHTEYGTDEEQLQKDIGWIQPRERNRKKRKMNESPEKSLRLTQKKEEVKIQPEGDDLAKETEWIRKKSKLRNETKSSYNPQPGSSSEKKEAQTQNKKVRPPPIIIYDENNYQILRERLCKKITQFEAKILGNGTFKINVPNEETYRDATRYLNEEHINWSSYENKQNRPIKVMIKKLPETCEPEAIAEELNERGFHVLDVVNILQWKSKKPLPIFRVTFDYNTDINKIYRINTVQNVKVLIEPMKTSKLIPQCKNCQAWGHTRRYCHRAPRCVKCAEKHLTNQCKKNKSEPPKCYNCGQQHPANYRGCEVIKEMQKMRYRNAINNKTSMPAQQRKVEVENKNPNPKKIQSEQTYAEKVKVNTSLIDAPTLSSINQMLQLILQKLEKQEKEHKIISTRLEAFENLRNRGAKSKTNNGK